VTEPWGYESDHKYVNACVKVLTDRSPREVLELTQQIERQMGRKKKTVFDADSGTFAYADRPIDIDILLYDELTVDEPDLQIPHPRMAERDFVMIPLAEVRDER
jgi:2-amino-4-hydroxy-6-hydroxymethyldihydropteridine diphosphokinase